MKIEGTQFRTVTIEAERADDKSRTVTAALSSETPVKRFFGTEVLEHADDAINWERAANGLPLLWSHDHEAPIGRVEGIRVDDDRVLRGTFTFSRNAKAQEVWQDVRDGFLRDVSIGYSIDEYSEEDDDVIRVTKWTPLEASLVTVPADSRAGINRKHEGLTMSEDTNTPDAADNETRQQKPADVKQEYKLFRLDTEQERRKGAELEAARRDGVRDLFAKYERLHGDAFTEIREQCERNPDISLDKAKEIILEAVADGYVSVDVTATQDQGSAYRGLSDFGKSTRVSVGQEAGEKLTRSIELAVSEKAGLNLADDEKRALEGIDLRGMTVSEMAREWLRSVGERPSGDKYQVLGQAFKRSGPSHGTGHFASVLENVANKSLLAAFNEAAETWQWAQSINVPDFKTNSLLNTSLFSDLEEIPEGGQYTYGDMSDIKEEIQVLTFGRMFGITRQAIADDDLGALSVMPARMGRAAARLIGDKVYAVLTTGTSTTMLQDSTALFDASHSNYVTSGGAPSVTTLDAARTAMALQTDPAGKTLGIQGRYLIVPVALQTTAEVLIAATYDPASTAGTLEPNPFRGSLQVVADHRLDTFNSSGWFIAAAENQVVVAFLNGQQTPYMESKDGWDIDGVSYKVRLDVAATASDYRGLYYNDGVT